MRVKMLTDHRELLSGKDYDLPAVRALALVEKYLAEKIDEPKVETATREAPSTATRAPQRRRKK